MISSLDLEDLQSSYCHRTLLSAGRLLPGSSLWLYRTLEGSKQGVSPASALLPSIQPRLTTRSPFGHLRALEKQKVDLSHTYAEGTCARDTVTYLFAVSPLLYFRSKERNTLLWNMKIAQKLRVERGVFCSSGLHFQVTSL